MDQKQRSRVLVVPHTHWDRAWYWPAERFRIKLIDCVQAIMRELKADPEYQFTFDGQVLPLEDYLAVRPEDTAFLKDAARAGRIKMGPMYCLSDLYCTGGESLIRNLLLGRKWCERFGAGYQQALHMPDTFGITPSIPMIAAGFGMKSFIFMRGLAGQSPGLNEMIDLQGIEPQLPLNTRHFLWRSPDGSEIRTIILRDGYANAAYYGPTDANGRLEVEPYAAQLREAAQKQDDGAGPPFLLLAGSDHMIPYLGQGDAMRLASQDDGYEFAYSNLDEAAAMLQAADAASWPVFQGEFHGSGACTILGGTLTARIYLKQRNAEVEQLLVHQAEPGAAALRLLGRTEATDSALDHAWKTLLITHPHDDICGCSVDSVHRANEQQMQHAWESADAIRRRMMIGLFRHYGANVAEDLRPSFALMNFQGTERRGPARLQFDYEGQRSWGDIQLADAYAVVDERGQPVPFREVSRGRSTEQPRMVTDLEIYAPLAPATFTRFFVEPRTSWPEWEKVKRGVLENEFLRVTMHENGAFDLEDKSTGQRSEGLGLFSDQADVGDEYDFSDLPSEPENLFESLAFEVRRREWPGGVLELKARGTLPIPATTDAAKQERSAEITELPMEISLVLAPGARQVEVILHFTNTAANHRLRWNLALGRKVETSLTGLKFNVIERPAGSAPKGDKPPRIWPEHPCDHFVAAANLCLFSRFPGNYEVVGDGTSRLAFTILRSTSWLTNPVNSHTRPGANVGPHTFTPDAQCLRRTFDMHFAVRPFAPQERDDLFRQAILWRAEPLAGQTDATVRYPLRESQPAPESLYSVNEPLVVSACKPSIQSDGCVLRVFNPTSVARSARLRVPRCEEWAAVNLDETAHPAAQIRCEGKEHLAFEIPPFGCRTFKLMQPS